MVLGVVSRFCLFWLAVTSKGVAVFFWHEMKKKFLKSLEGNKNTLN